ncbi:unnamed protein product [Ectocarpus sp. 8 AP-2014]
MAMGLPPTTYRTSEAWHKSAVDKGTTWSPAQSETDAESVADRETACSLLQSETDAATTWSRVEDPRSDGSPTCSLGAKQGHLPSQPSPPHVHAGLGIPCFGVYKTNRRLHS